MALLSPNKSSGDLLSITSSKGGLKAEVATILGAQQFFHEAGAPKRSVLPTHCLQSFSFAACTWNGRLLLQQLHRPVGLSL